jgi:HD superfamily phosphohydrolase
MRSQPNMNNKTLFHVIKDPVHGTMQFTTTENQWIKPFIDSPHMQRLRHIKQLGMGDFIFPGSVHTRFNHSLGCCFIASQISQKIGLASEERQLVMIACLLHDVGHGPFSHAFEDLFHHKLIRHEAWTPYFLAEYRTSEFFNEYNRHNPRHHLTKEKFLSIEEMIMHKTKNSRLLADIVSSQLDADRLDYLLRDSHFCGVRYGEFDFRWMINSMVIVDSAEGERLGLTHKGIGVAEHYLMARRLMMRNIYLNPKKLALEFFMVKLLTNLAENLEQYAPYAAIKDTRLGHFLCRANQFNQEVKVASKTETLKKQFLQENFADYKELADYDVFAIIKILSQMPVEQPAAQIAKRIHYRQMPKIIHIDHADIPRAEKILKEFKSVHQDNIQDWQLAIIKTPHQSYTIEEDPILILNEYGLVKPLNTLSLMINAIGDKLEHTAFLCIDRMIYETNHVQNLCRELGYISLPKYTVQ